MVDRAQSTSLNLLSRDGAICATFTPALTPEQYDQLLVEIERDGDREGQMTALLQALARHWNREIVIDPC